MTDRLSRRGFLAATAGAGVVGLAGCLDAIGQLTGGSDAREDAESGEDPHRARTIDEVPENTELPLRERVTPLAHDLGAYEEEAEWGGVGKDGIPSVDEPQFETASTGDGMLDPGDPVFGVELDGDARAYPQRILVRHEVVNDGFGDTGVAVTYCPLTGTAIGFERGSVEFGVSGMLTNSNLVMYDRETDSWWPQMLGASVLGERKGLALEPVRVTWTTWERWRETHPDSIVLTEDTGQAFDYGDDPYGSYNPRGGYYDDSNLRFPVMNESDRHSPKRVFVGARSPDGPVAFEKRRLREDRLLDTTVEGVSHVATYHEGLDSAWVYRNPDDVTVESDGDGFRVDGNSHGAAELPLESVHTFDAMWFAWYGFYPNTEVVA